MSALFVFVALVVGLSLALMPWYVSVALVAVPLLLLVVAARPLVGAILAVALIFEVIPGDFQPTLPLGAGALKQYDILILFLAAAMFIRHIFRSESIESFLGPMRWPLLYVLVAVIGSGIYVTQFAHNSNLLSEGRASIAWLLLPVLASAVDDRARFRTLMTAILGLALVVALYVTLQSLFEIRIMTAARVEMLDAGSNRDVTRSIAGGGIYLVVLALLYFVNILFDKRQWWLLLPCGLLVLGLGVQFGRGIWVATILGLLLSTYLYRGWKGLVGATSIAAIVVGVLLIGLSVSRPRMAAAMIERAAGIQSEMEHGGSFRWRLFEADSAIKAIRAHPLMGVGVGGEYKRKHSGGFAIETTYIHNSYLYFPLKYGLWASLVPFSFIVAFLVAIRQGVASQVKSEGHWDRAFVGALVGAFAVPVITSFTQPEWVVPQGIAAYSILLGLALMFRRFGSPGTLFSSVAANPKTVEH